MVWAGDEWESLAPEEGDPPPPFDEQRVLSHKKASSSSSSRPSPPAGVSTTEVKIRITKKELQELLGKAEVQNLSSEQVLTRLINAGRFGNAAPRHGDDDDDHHHHWRPGLTSIPEVN